MFVRILKWILLGLVSGWLVGLYAQPANQAKHHQSILPTRLLSDLANHPAYKTTKPQAVKPVIDNQALFVELTDQYEMTRMQTQLVKAQIKLMQSKIALMKLRRNYALLDTADNLRATPIDEDPTFDALHLVALTREGGIWKAVVRYHDLRVQLTQGKRLYKKWHIEAIGPQGVYIKSDKEAVLLNFHQATRVKAPTPKQTPRPIDKTTAAKKKRQRTTVLKTAGQRQPH